MSWPMVLSHKPKRFQYRGCNIDVCMVMHLDLISAAVSMGNDIPFFIEAQRYGVVQKSVDAFIDNPWQAMLRNIPCGDNKIKSKIKEHLFTADKFDETVWKILCAVQNESIYLAITAVNIVLEVGYIRGISLDKLIHNFWAAREFL